MKAIIFDLDDTLYDEMTYVKQAFCHTAEYIYGYANCKQASGGKYASFPDSQAIYERMLEILSEDGRGKIFDRILEETGVDIPVAELVDIYRDTTPILSLYEDAERLLDNLQAQKEKYQTALITDGLSKVQNRKIEALHLNTRLDVVIASDDLGLHKPQKELYFYCLEKLGVRPSDAVYIGDNPKKDFIGAREIGMHTIHLKRERGMCVDYVAEPGYEADEIIYSLDEVLPLIEK